MTDEPLTPVQAERLLSQLVTDITHAQTELRQARIEETKAEIAHRKAVIRAGHDAPKVQRGQVTVDERNAVIDEATVEPWLLWRQAVTLREIAQDALRARLAVAEVVRSLSASVRASYAMAGAS